MIRDSDRSRHIVQRLGDRIASAATCGLHIHVAVPRSQAIRVVDAMQAFVPPLVALAANFPVMSGREPLLASQRANVWAHELPTSGFPRRFGDWDGFEAHVRTLQRAGIIESQKDLYYLVRPTRFGTVEVRCADLPPHVDLAVDLAALVQALAVGIQENSQLRLPVEVLHADLTNAIMDGPRAILTSLDGRRLPLPEVLAQIFERLHTVAERFGTLSSFDRMRRRAAYADRVRAKPCRVSPTPQRRVARVRRLGPVLAAFAAGWLMAVGVGL